METPNHAWVNLPIRTIGGANALHFWKHKYPKLGNKPQALTANRCLSFNGTRYGIEFHKQTAQSPTLFALGNNSAPLPEDWPVGLRMGKVECYKLGDLFAKKLRIWKF